eukprot:g43741.t1
MPKTSFQSYCHETSEQFANFRKVPVSRNTRSGDQTLRPGSREAENLYAGIQSNNYNVRSDSLKGLAVLSKDITFAQEFISKDGIAVLVRIVENGHDTGESLAHALNAFIELMEHGVVSWETLNHVFIKKIAGFVNKSAMDASIQQLSLAILESMVLSSGFLFQLVKSEVPLDRLISHLQ